ncbi:HNH endonuclease [Neorhizobium sp. DAR64872/K0K18]|uniref:HNH endonuclease n=1 Tax=Neorhizobium sp. DAR64872/K0K18 TaxID=3421958 RepID=UPI003D27F96B
MRKLDRTVLAAPASISTPIASVEAEINDAAVYYEARNPWVTGYTAYSFKMYKQYDVKAALKLLTHGKCAFCESKVNVVGAREVEHFRPKGGIKGLTGHPGYWWLAHSWDNLLPACIDCNRSKRQHIVTAEMTRAEVEELQLRRPSSSFGKKNQFDIKGVRASDHTGDLEAEDPLLIDPTLRDPADHLTWNFDTELTIVEPRGGCEYGNYTINTCALNRADLVLARIPALRPMRAIRVQILNRLKRWAGSDDELHDILETVGVLGEFAEPDQQYSAMATDFISGLEQELSAWLNDRGIHL